MYYYIIEQPKNRTERNLQKKIKDIVSLSGIAGETAFVSPARQVDELVRIALVKNYSTIVAVGSDKIINKVASLLCSGPAVMGIIPIQTSPIINQIFQIDVDVENACRVLKERHLKIVDLAYLYPGKYFLTKAEIKTPLATQIDFEIDHYKVTTKISDLTIVSPAINTLSNLHQEEIETSDNRLNIFLHNRFEQPGTIKKFFNSFTNKIDIDRISSLLRGRKLIIDSETPLSLVIDDQIVAKTPVFLTTKPKALKIITSRAKIDLLRNDN